MKILNIRHEIRAELTPCENILENEKVSLVFNKLKNFAMSNYAVNTPVRINSD